MILKDHQSKKTGYPRLFYLIFLFVIASVTIWIFSISLRGKTSSTSVFYCNAEKVSEEWFKNRGHRFSGGTFRSDEQAYSGLYSMKLDSGYQYGFEFVLENPEPGTRYKASVMQYRTDRWGGQLVITSDDQFYHFEKIPEAGEENGWELLQTTFNVPLLDPPLSHLKFYIFKPKDNPATYYDDFLIERLDDQRVASGKDSVFLPLSLNLMLELPGLNQLSDKRLEALRRGYLFTEEDDWVKGFLQTDDNKLPVRIRLKGDAMDHFNSDKWSYRVKVKDPHAWNRMVTFSLQNPPTRNFLSEWVFHKFLEREDILCPRYDFINFHLNNEFKGIYAYEEHFSKQLVEFKDRREGPIVKFDEDVFWLNALREKQTFGHPILNERYIRPSETAGISPFHENKTAESENLTGQYNIAQSLMRRYQYGQAPASEIFDLERLARFVASVDINKAFHALVWHNQRFYYNPVIGKLEPIGFDGYGAGMDNWIGNRPFYGFQSSHPNSDLKGIHFYLITDRDFMTAYIKELERLTRPENIVDFRLDIEEGWKARLDFLQTEFKDYKFDTRFIERQAKKIRIVLFPYNDHSLQVRTGQIQEDSVILHLQNTHCLPVTVIGAGYTSVSVDFPIDEPVWMHAHLNTKLTFDEVITVPESSRFVFYKVPGIDSVFYSSVSKWSPPQIVSPATELAESSDLENNPALDIEGEVIVFKPGVHNVNSSIVIPEGYEVYFKAGCRLNFIEQSGFISNSPVFMNGTEENPVHIYSEDQTGMGFTVLQSPARSSISHTIFEDLNTLDYNSWKLTGAVTFYESDVDIINTRILDNNCEDALNIIRSEFRLVDSEIRNTPFDGFDADFCKGTISNSAFLNIGNDGMDFSGSIINIENATVKKAGDKGISVGEQAKVKCKNCVIENALTGVASKDLSTLSISRLILKNCRQGLTAYQKKPEFGGGNLAVWDLTATDVEQLYLIENGSKIKIDGKALKSN